MESPIAVTDITRGIGEVDVKSEDGGGGDSQGWAGCRLRGRLSRSVNDGRTSRVRPSHVRLAARYRNDAAMVCRAAIDSLAADAGQEVLGVATLRQRAAGDDDGLGRRRRFAVRAGAGRRHARWRRSGRHGQKYRTIGRWSQGEMSLEEAAEWDAVPVLVPAADIRFSAPRPRRGVDR